MLFESFVKRHPRIAAAALIFAFVVWTLPIGISQAWSAWVKDKTIPQWLEERRWPFLTTGLYNWITAGLALIVVALFVNFLLVRRRNAASQKQRNAARQWQSFDADGPLWSWEYLSEPNDLTPVNIVPHCPKCRVPLKIWSTGLVAKREDGDHFYRARMVCPNHKTKYEEIKTFHGDYPEVTRNILNKARAINLSTESILRTTKTVEEITSMMRSQLPPEYDAASERVVTDKSIEDLIKPFGANSTRDAKKLVEEYIGQWMRTAGIISDITEDNTFAFTAQKPYVIMYFEKEWDERLAKKKRGDRLAVLGRIIGVDSFYLKLDHCELIRHPDDPPPTRAEIIKQLSNFAEEGDLLLRQGKEKTEPDWTRAKNWGMRVETYIRDNIDDASAAYFSLSTSPNLYPGLAINRAFVNWIYTRLQRLDRLATEVRHR